MTEAARRTCSGMHFFSPANVMKLLEIVRGEQTAPDVLATAMAVGRKIGKVPVVVGVCHGFVGNRMLRARTDRGRAAAARRRAAAGRRRRADRVRLPDGAVRDERPRRHRCRLAHRARRRGARAEIADTLCELGRFGQKTGKGFYPLRGRRAHADPRPGGRGADRRRLEAARRHSAARSTRRRSSSA